MSEVGIQEELNSEQIFISADRLCLSLVNLVFDLFNLWLALLGLSRLIARLLGSAWLLCFFAAELKRVSDRPHFDCGCLPFCLFNLLAVFAWQIYNRKAVA